jgi:cation/acetate symporter
MFPELNTADNWLFSISPEGIGFVGMLLNVSVSLIVSSLTSPPPKEVSMMVEEIRQP